MQRDPSPAEERELRERRMAQLRAYMTVRDRLPEFVGIVAEAETREAARLSVAKRFELSVEQADTLLALRVAQMVRTDMRDVDIELRDNEARLAELSNQ
jgi:DNA gyrase/topoisomerase IV subunit A